MGRTHQENVLFQKNKEFSWQALDQKERAQSAPDRLGQLDEQMCWKADERSRERPV